MMNLIMNKNYIVIGVDPGTVKLGYSVIEKRNGKVSLLISGVIVFNKNDTLSQKLLYIFDFFKALVERYRDLSERMFFSLEEQYCKKNPQSAFVLVSCSSILLLISAMENITFLSFAPSKIKKIVSGDGSADKEMIYLSLQNQFSIDFSILSFDESDAIAIALSGILSIDLKR